MVAIMSLRYPKWDCRFSHNGMQLGSTGNMNGIVDDPPILNFPTCPPQKKKGILDYLGVFDIRGKGLPRKDTRQT